MDTLTNRRVKLIFSARKVPIGHRPRDDHMLAADGELDHPEHCEQVVPSRESNDIVFFVMVVMGWLERFGAGTFDEETE